MSDQLERCKKSLRSILLANKGGVAARQIFKEYQTLYEERIPYQALGFSTLEKFLMSIPDVCVITTRRGELTIEGVASSGTSHISKLVQRTGGKKGGGGGGYGGYGGGGGYGGRSGSSVAPAARRTVAVGPHQNTLKPAFPRPSAVSSLPAPAARSARSPPPPPSSRLSPKAAAAPSPAVLTSRPKLKVAGLGQVMSGAAKTRTIPSIEKPAEREWDLVVTAVETTREVWVRPQTSVKILEQLEAKMLKKQHNMCFNGGLMPPGNYFSAEVEAGQVRRAKVLKVDRTRNTAHVTLIDYGCQLDIPWRKLVPLDMEFWSVRAQALRIQLDGFVSYHNLDVLEFAKKKLVGRRVFGREVNASLSQSVPLVNIFEADPQGDLMFVENLRDQMRKINLGNVAPAKGGRELGLKITINNNISEEKTLAGSLQLPRLPGVNEFYDCVVVEVVEAGELYVHPYDSLASYKTLNRQMFAFYSVNRGSLIQSPEPGQVVAARVGEGWFRAEIVRKLDSLLDSKDNQNFLVKLVDTGKVEIVGQGSMKVLQTEFFSLPRQAVRVKLEGLRQAGQAAAVWLRHICLGQSLVGHIKTKQEDRLGLVLYDTSREDLDININKELVALGLASKKED